MPTVILRTAGGDRVLSHAFREVPMPDGSILLDLSANGGDDGEGVDLHASTHFVGGTDSLESVYANIADLELGGYAIPMASVEPGASNAVIIAGTGSSLDSITNGGAGTVLRGGASGGGSTGMSFGQVTDSHFGGQLGVAHGGTNLAAVAQGDLLHASALNTIAALAIGAAGTVLRSGGTVPAWSGWTTPSTFPAGSMPYASALDTLAALAVPGAASVLTHTGPGGMPAWVAALAKAQQHAQTAYLDANNDFTGNQHTIRPTATQPLLRLMANNAVGGSAAGGPELRFYDSTSTRMGRIVCSIATGSKYFGFVSETDRDGFHPPIRFLTTDNAGSTGTVLLMHADADAGKATIKTALGIGFGTSVTSPPSATLHVIETNEGGVPEMVRLGNQSTTSGSGTEVGFHASTSGAQKYASIQAVTEAASAARGAIVLATQRASSGNPVEGLRLDGKGNVSIGTAAVATNATDGFLYIPTCAGTPTGVPTAKTGLAPLVYDSTNNKLYVYNGAWKTTTVFA